MVNGAFKSFVHQNAVHVQLSSFFLWQSMNTDKDEGARFSRVQITRDTDRRESHQALTFLRRRFVIEAIHRHSTLSIVLR